MVGISYEGFLDLPYEPTDSDLVCGFYVEPAADRDSESAASGRLIQDAAANEPALATALEKWGTETPR